MKSFVVGFALLMACAGFSAQKAEAQLPNLAPRRQAAIQPGPAPVRAATPSPVLASDPNVTAPMDPAALPTPPQSSKWKLKKRLGTLGKGLCKGAMVVGQNALAFTGRFCAGASQYPLSPSGPMPMMMSNPPVSMITPSPITPLAPPLIASGSMSSRNIFGGQNIIHSDGGMTTTMPNVFGGYNIYSPNGGMTTTMKNVFGGQNIYGSDGMTTTMPNVFGGQNIYTPSGGMITTMPNLMGGFNVFP